MTRQLRSDNDFWAAPIFKVANGICILELKQQADQNRFGERARLIWLLSRMPLNCTCRNALFFFITLKLPFCGQKYETSKVLESDVWMDLMRGWVWPLNNLVAFHCIGRYAKRINYNPPCLLQGDPAVNAGLDYTGFSSQMCGTARNWINSDFLNLLFIMRQFTVDVVHWWITRFDGWKAGTFDPYGRVRRPSSIAAESIPQEVRFRLSVNLRAAQDLCMLCMKTHDLFRWS